MAVFTYPAVSSPVKSVQRGSAAGAGSVTITAVDIAKSFCNIFGTTSSGTVAASGAVSGITGNIASALVDSPAHYTSTYRVENNGGFGNGRVGRVPATSFTGNASNITGGSTNLVAAVVQGFLANSTTLTVSGACRWEVVEFN